MMFINELPVELLVIIFSYISHFDLFVNLKNVCVLWRELSMSPLCWRILDTKHEEQISKNRYIDKPRDIVQRMIKSFSRHLTDLKYRNCVDIKWMKNKYGNVEPFNIVTNTLIERIELSSLQRLTITSYGKDPLELDHLDDICKSLPNLSELKIFTDLPLYNLSKNNVSFLRKLKRFEIHDLVANFNQICMKSAAINIYYRSLFRILPNITGFSSRVLDNSSLRFLLVDCHSITRLHLNACPNVTIKGFKEIPKLTSLIDLYLCLPNLDDTCIELVLSHSPSLQKLTLRSFSHITDTGHAFIGQYCPQLISLDIGLSEGTVNGSGLALTLPRLNHLKVLNIKNCKYIDDSILQLIGNSCPGLRILKASGCSEITNIGVEAIAHKCKHLQHVNLNNCEKITFDGISAILQSCRRLKSLRNRHMFCSCCHTHSGIHEMSTETNLSIRNLELNENHQMNQSIDMQISEWCPYMKEIYIAECLGLKDIHVETLLQRCVFLEILDISSKFGKSSEESTSDITNKALEHISRYSEHLHTLYIRNNRNIDSSGILNLYTSHARIQCVSFNFLGGLKELCKNLHDKKIGLRRTLYLPHVTLHGRYKVNQG